jgi:hypothetical protein
MNTSNIADVTRFLSNFIDSFDFLRVGIDQNLGRDVKMKVVKRIYDRSLDQRSGINGQWDKNEPAYKAWKEAKYGVDEPNTRTGQMLSQKSIEGRSTIEAKQVTMIYGTGDLPDKAAFVGALPVRTRGPKKGQPVDDKTDIEKAYFAHTGQGPHGVKRPFYEVDASDGKAVVELIRENVNGAIREENAKNGY